DQKTEVIRLQLHPPRRLTLEQSSQLYRSGTSRQKCSHQKIAGDSRMHQPLDQQHMPASNVEFLAEKNLQPFQSRLVRPSLVYVPGLEEGTNHRYLQQPDQVGSEHEPIFKHGDDMNRLTPIIVRNLPRQFSYPFLNLLGRNYLPQQVSPR